MKCFASLVFVLALGIVAGAGCSESRPNLCAGAPCDDGNGCTDDVCDPSDGSCSNVPLEDGAFCDIGYCQNGECDAIDSVFDCSEQGIRDAIAAGGGPHAFDCDGATVVRTEDVIVIDNDVTLDGLGELTIHGNDAHTVVIVEADAKAELVRITVSNGSDVGLEWGIGGIQNLGTLAMTNCIVSDNIGEGPGGISNSGTLTMMNCIVSGNDSVDSVAGMSNGGTLTMTNCIVTENSATDEGGIYNSGKLEMTNTTISHNNGEAAGGIYNRGDLTMTASTVSDNEWQNIVNYRDGELSIINSTVSGNPFAGSINNFANLTMTHCTIARSGSGEEAAHLVSSGGAVTLAHSLVEGACSGDITSGGYNIESPGNTCGFDQTGDQSDVSSKQLNLGPLADNGGATMTHKPGDGDFGDGSVAIDPIPGADCALDTDQRGERRPAGPDPKRCDVGAVEVQP